MIFKKLNLFHHRGLFVKGRQVLLIASYSRNSSNSKNAPFKLVQSRLKNGRQDGLVHENGLNWELFGTAKNNRFFLQSGSVGPAFMNSKTTSATDGINLNDLVDFENKDKKRLQISTQKCPILMRKNLHELFPAPEVIAENDKITLITLSQGTSASGDHERTAIQFVHAAREICSRLRLHGFWSDFLNPFSGRPFHSYHQKALYKLNDVRFRGLCMKFEEISAEGGNENCVILCEDKSLKFSGSIFSNIPANLEMMKELILDD